MPRSVGPGGPRATAEPLDQVLKLMVLLMLTLVLMLMFMPMLMLMFQMGEIKIQKAHVETVYFFSETSNFWDAVFRASQKIGTNGIRI